MQITRITAWAYDGHNYATELSAVEANLKAIGQKIAKHHSSSPVSGLIEYRDDLAPLLIRHAELAEVASAKEPEGTQAEVSLEDMEFPVVEEAEEVRFEPVHDVDCAAHFPDGLCDCVAVFKPVRRDSATGETVL